MASPVVGAGFAPAGFSPAGSGTPATGPDEGGCIQRDTLTGKKLGARLIDPVTRDCVYDANGRALGMSGTRQRVQLALSTRKYSSAMLTLGEELAKIKRITANFSRLVRDAVTGALQHLLDENAIEIIAITTERVGQTSGFTHVRWRDLTTHEEATERVG